MQSPVWLIELLIIVSSWSPHRMLEREIKHEGNSGAAMIKLYWSGDSGDYLQARSAIDCETNAGINDYSRAGFTLIHGRNSQRQLMPVGGHRPFLREAVVPAFRAWIQDESLDVLNNSRFLVVRFFEQEEVVTDFLRSGLRAFLDLLCAS